MVAAFDEVIPFFAQPTPRRSGFLNLPVALLDNSDPQVEGEED